MFTTVGMIYRFPVIGGIRTVCSYNEEEIKELDKAAQNCNAPHTSLMTCDLCGTIIESWSLYTKVLHLIENHSAVNDWQSGIDTMPTGCILPDGTHYRGDFKPSL